MRPVALKRKFSHLQSRCAHRICGHVPIDVQPVIALRGFKRIHLEPAQSTAVTFDVGADELSILNTQMKRVVEPGEVDVLIGANSVDTSAVQLTVTP